MNVDRVLNIIASVLYAVERMRMPAGRAFHYVCSRFGCGAAGIDREELFMLSRNFISNYYRVRYIAESARGEFNPSYRMLAKIYLYLKFREEGGVAPGRLRKSVLRDFPEIDRFMDGAEAVPPWARLSYPRWFYEKLIEVLPAGDVEKLLEAMNREVLWIRVNTLRIDVDRAFQQLETEGVMLERDRDVPFLARVVRSVKPIRRIELFRNGSIVVQDKASVLTVLAAKPERGMVVYDFAAAPGIKTSLIMQLTENRSRVVAVDFSMKRLSTMKLLLNHYGVDASKVDLIHADSRRISFRCRADLALVDAACSNSGAVSRDPSVKIVLRDQQLPEKMKSTQIEMLLNALKHSNTTIYSVCSLLPDEGEEVVSRVVERISSHKLVDTGLNISRGYRGYDVWSAVSRTFPHIDRCEGFFIARFEM